MVRTMADDRAPREVQEWARARAAARTARDWAEADRLRAEIEGAGWTIVDDGLRYRLRPAHPPDELEGEPVRYGRSLSVPSMLDEPPTDPLTVVIVASPVPSDTDRAVASVRGTAPAGSRIVVVADGIDLDAVAADEIVRTTVPLGHAAALNCGLRRAMSSIVAILDPSVEVAGDTWTPLMAALDDPTVAVAGGFGIVTDDLRHFRDGPAGDVDAIEGYLMAFRRADYASRGPLDEHFRFYRNLDIWWSLVLRDEGEGSAPRRAVAMPDLPLVRHEHRGWTSMAPDERDRLSRRNFYRILDRFRDRRDLLTSSGG
jgi:cysteinyl-tRNA synthetase